MFMLIYAYMRIMLFPMHTGMCTSADANTHHQACTLSNTKNKCPQNLKV